MMCDLTLPFGKHLNKSVREVAYSDPRYLFGLLGRHWFVRDWPKLAEEAARFLCERYAPERKPTPQLRLL